MWNIFEEKRDKSDRKRRRVRAAIEKKKLKDIIYTKMILQSFCFSIQRSSCPPLTTSFFLACFSHRLFSPSFILSFPFAIRAHRNEGNQFITCIRTVYLRIRTHSTYIRSEGYALYIYRVANMPNHSYYFESSFSTSSTRIIVSIIAKDEIPDELSPK